MPINFQIKSSFNNVIFLQYSVGNKRFFIYLNFTYFFGAIAAVALAFALVPGLDAAHWRWLVAIGGIPALPGAILSFTHLRESPRHLLAHRKYEEAE